MHVIADSPATDHGDGSRAEESLQATSRFVRRHASETFAGPISPTRSRVAWYLIVQIGWITSNTAWSRGLARRVQKWRPLASESSVKVARIAQNMQCLVAFAPSSCRLRRRNV